MPIKFRCVHCNKLLGIARRKAGTIVACPECEQQLIVPSPEEPEAEPEDDQPTLQPELPRPANKLFEQDNFEMLLQEQDAATYRQNDGPDTVAPPRPAPFAAERNLPVPATVAAPAPMYAPAPAYPFPTEAPPPVPPAGVVLSGSKIMILLVILFFLLAGAFGAGIFVGKSLNAPTAVAS